MKYPLTASYPCVGSLEPCHVGRRSIANPADVPRSAAFSRAKFALVCAANPSAVLELAAALPVREGPEPKPEPKDGVMHRQWCPTGLVAVSRRADGGDLGGVGMLLISKQGDTAEENPA